MSNPQDNTASILQKNKKVLIASLTGSAIEWFDYFLYGTAAALVFNKIFFPMVDPVIGLILSWLSFSLTFFIRPIGGVIFAKIVNIFLAMAGKKPINPMIGGCGISAFPMSSRVVQKLAAAEEPGNIILMQAAGTNVSGQVASVIAGGLVISVVTQYL